MHTLGGYRVGDLTSRPLFRIGRLRKVSGRVPVIMESGCGAMFTPSKQASKVLVLFRLTSLFTPKGHGLLWLAKYRPSGAQWVELEGGGDPRLFLHLS